LPPNDDVPRDFGTAEIGGLDVGSELLRSGWAKIKELKRDPTEEDLKKKDLEAEAKGTGKGLWNPHGPKVRRPIFTSGHGRALNLAFGHVI
jgi:staphylococcal nuclease domain-containing protein 1